MSPADNTMSTGERGSGVAAADAVAGGVTTASTFDTSGAVWVGLTERQNFTPMNWSDLSPFVQGCVEAMFRLPIAGHSVNAFGPCRFSDLAHETLTRITEDCERVEGLSCFYLDEAKAAGRTFWRWRQSGIMADHGMEPLTPYLGDDGKVYLREVSQ